MAVCSRCGAEIPGDAHFCPRCGAPVADERPTEERKLATVLFADLVGSTAHAGPRIRSARELCSTASTTRWRRKSSGLVGRSRSSSVTRSWPPSAHRVRWKTTLSGRCTPRSRCSAGLRPDPRPLQAPSGPPSPKEFSDPRDYAAALTRYSLGFGGTNVLDRPDCSSRLTWADWTCTVRAKATNGPFAGVVLTYRCYPIGHGVLCGPKNPPPLAAAGGS